jgi:hypothetical protein
MKNKYWRLPYKKYFIGIFYFCNCLLLFPQSETWESIGFEFGNLFQNVSHNGDRANIFMGSPGLNYYHYEFSNFRKIGFYVRQSLLFKGITSTNVGRDYNTIMHTSTTIGPGIRKEINEKICLKFAVGFSYMLSSTVYAYNDSMENQNNINHKKILCKLYTFSYTYNKQM